MPHFRDSTHSEDYLRNLVAGGKTNPSQYAELSKFMDLSWQPIQIEAYAMLLADALRSVLQTNTTFDKLTIAKTMVDLTKQSDTSYPILTSEDAIISSLSPQEVAQLRIYIEKIVAVDHASVAGACLSEFLAELK